MRPEDLAPNDRKSLERDWSGVELHRIDSLEHPLFRVAYDALWKEFGERREMETPEVLAKRMAWEPQERHEGCALKYRLFLIMHGEEIVAVRDHTAIVPPSNDGCVVHLSHALVLPDWRRSGIAGWLRALPVTTARNTLRAVGLPEELPITLVGEMEPLDENEPATVVRLKAYENAGYQKVDPKAVPYLQPDFRPPEEIERSGGARPLRLNLVIRRVGRENETTIRGREVRSMVEALYRMYAVGFRAQDMAPLFEALKDYPSEDAEIALLAPTA